MIRLRATARYTVAGEAGVWRYVGQATYVDDHGREVDHDYVRMARVGQDGHEVWVAPEDVTRLAGRVASVA